MARFYSYPGSKPVQSDERRPVMDPRDNPQYAEFFAHRAATSHRSSGLDIEADPTKGNVKYKGDPARVVHEEYDQHSGELHTYVARSSRTGSGTTKVTWKPDGDRRIVIADQKAVHE